MVSVKRCNLHTQVYEAVTNICWKDCNGPFTRSSRFPGYIKEQVYSLPHKNFWNFILGFQSSILFNLFYRNLK